MKAKPRGGRFRNPYTFGDPGVRAHRPEPGRCVPPRARPQESTQRGRAATDKARFIKPIEDAGDLAKLIARGT